MLTWEKCTDVILGETIYKHRHPSGLEISFLPKKGFTKKYAYFGTKYGSFNNCFEKDGKRYCMPKGIAHFLEHKIFEDKERNIFDRFAALGASVNAYTSFNATVYHFSTVDHFDEALTELLKFVQRVNLTVENVEKEKGIIVQELKSYEDDPEYVVFFNLLRGLYSEHPMRDDIGGDEASVNAITMEELITCYEAFYAPENMTIIISGDIDETQLLEQIYSNLSEEFLSRTTAKKEALPKETSIVNQKYIEATFDVPMPIFEFGVKAHANFDSDEALLKTAVSVKIILDAYFGKGSDLYKALYDEGLINSTFGMDYTFGENYAYYAFGGESKTPEIVKERLLEAAMKMSEEGVSEESFTRIKRKMIGRLISSANSVQYLSNAYVSYYMKGMDLFDYIRIISETQMHEGLIYMKDSFREENTCLSVVRQGGEVQ